MKPRFLLLAFLLLAPATAAAQSDLLHELNLSHECKTEFLGFETQVFDTDGPEGRVLLYTPKQLSLECKAEILRNMLAHPDRPTEIYRPAPIWWSDLSDAFKRP